MDVVQIARQLDMDRKTVKKYVEADECPTYLKRSKLDQYMGYMTQRWEFSDDLARDL